MDQTTTRAMKSRVGSVAEKLEDTIDFLQPSPDFDAALESTKEV